MNRLAHETSPYLRQHADNPVDWYPWGDEAFAKARAEDKPVLLSVGYSSCHWCHVMAHESFENADIAAMMNERFVNVKVDREERPDVDAIYMMAVQSMVGRGGWPMTVFLDADGRPFYGGTYFPDTDRQGMPGFPRVLAAIDNAWRSTRDELLEQANTLVDHVTRSSTLAMDAGDPHAVDPAVLDFAVARMHTQFDTRFGGFGGAPKFPQAMSLTFLLGRLARDPSPEALDMVTTSLDAMAAGGMYDQVGGGFHRYSVDAFWLVPHFEKMLYDQALLLRAYVHGWVVTGEPRYRRVAEEIVTYVLRDLRHADGGFFSAEDADSEGVEGKFYCWSLDELRAVCGDDADEVIRYFGATAGGNFEDPHTGFRGNILHVVDRSEDRPDAVTRALPRLRETRDARVRPGLDDKVLLGWNALFLDALAEAAFVFDRDDWMRAARANAEFLVSAMRGDDGRLLRSWQGGRAHLLAYAEDHAALLEALLTLTEVDDVAWLGEAN
ncbi:MAG: thioredoxin domain-containing protein, partial [Acidimicrobiia bacterium]